MCLHLFLVIFVYFDRFPQSQSMPDPNSCHLKVLEGRVLYHGGEIYFADLASNHNSHADEIVVALLILYIFLSQNGQNLGEENWKIVLLLRQILMVMIVMMMEVEVGT